MSEHPLELPTDILVAIHRHVANAVHRIDRTRYCQEPQYVAALFARLDGIAYDGPLGRLEFVNTIPDDRGRDSAERRWGADFAITASLERPLKTAIVKGVLGQAKIGSVESLSPSTYRDLEEKCSRMSSATQAILALEVPRSVADPVGIRIAAPRTHPLPIERGRVHLVSSFEFSDRLSLDAYLAVLLECLHGDLRSDFVHAVRDSSLRRLHLIAQTAAQ